MLQKKQKFQCRQHSSFIHVLFIVNVVRSCKTIKKDFAAEDAKLENSSRGIF
jgi:hypothetical protein